MVRSIAIYMCGSCDEEWTTVEEAENCCQDLDPAAIPKLPTEFYAEESAFDDPEDPVDASYQQQDDEDEDEEDGY